MYSYGHPTISYLTIYYLFTSHKFDARLEAWTDDIENMHIGNERSSLYCKLVKKVFHRYAFSFHLMVENDKLRSMKGLAFKVMVIGENKNGEMC